MTRELLKEAVERHGIDTVANASHVNKATLVRVLAGVKVREATRVCIESALLTLLPSNNKQPPQAA